MARHHDRLSSLTDTARRHEKRGDYGAAADLWSECKAAAEAHNEKGALSLATTGFIRCMRKMAEHYVRDNPPSWMLEIEGKKKPRQRRSKKKQLSVEDVFK